MTKKTLTMREQAFVREYLVDMIGAQAAIRAGYSPKTARTIAAQNLAKLHIADAISEAVAARFQRLDIKADALLARAATILRTDSRELTSHHIGACRYCWGIAHHYQWRTPREYSEAVELHMLKGEAYAANYPAPEQEGGYGYRKTDRPHPECPECDGLGVSYTVFADTRDLSPEAAILFEGVKETRNGAEFVMASKQEAFKTLAQHHGLLTLKHEHGGKDGQPVAHDVTARVIVVPAKVPSPTVSAEQSRGAASSSGEKGGTD